MSLFKGGYLGFSYGTQDQNGKFKLTHSSELGITRVSGGGRYDDNLLPAIQDKTVQVPGGDGTYYFGSYYTTKPFTLAIAFDEVTDAQIRQIKQLFGDKKTHKLIFDENPYKVYTVKATGTPNLKYVPFEVDNPLRYSENELDLRLSSKEELYETYQNLGYARVYKGEGTLTFTAYTPYATSRFKYLDNYTLQNIPEWASFDSSEAVFYNYDEWATTVALKKSTSYLALNDKHYIIDTPIIEGFNTDGVVFYNPGDFDTPFNLKFMYSAAGASTGNVVVGNNDRIIKIKSFVLNNQDYGFQINTKLNLLEGLDADGKITGNVYNRYITDGDFFKLPVVNELTYMPISINGENYANVSIEYNYLFF